jgi:hypothetical protein
MVRSKKEVQEMVEKEIASLEDAILASKTVVELKKIAKERGISLKGITKKADILKALGVSSPKAKAKSKKAPAKSKAKKTTAGKSKTISEDELLAQAKDALKKKMEVDQAFRKLFQPELKSLPSGLDLFDVVTYLSGQHHIRKKGVNYQLATETRISDDLRHTLEDLNAPFFL